MTTAITSTQPAAPPPRGILKHPPQPAEDTSNDSIQEHRVSLLTHRRRLDRLILRLLTNLSQNPSVSPATLARASAYLSKQTYSDLLYERTSLSICAWPLCPTAVTCHSKAKWRILYERRELVKVDHRRKFCGERCRRWSDGFESVLSEECVYVRDLNKWDYEDVEYLLGLRELKKQGPAEVEYVAHLLSKVAITSRRVAGDVKERPRTTPEETPRVSSSSASSATVEGHVVASTGYRPFKKRSPPVVTFAPSHESVNGAGVSHQPR